MTLDKARWRTNFDLRCWARAQKIGRNRPVEHLLLNGLAARVERSSDSTAVGRFDMEDLCDLTSAPQEQVVRALDRLAELGFITFEMLADERSIAVALPAQEGAGVTQRAALARALALVKRAQSEGTGEPEDIGLLVVIGYRCRGKLAQSYRVRDLVQAAEFGAPPKLYRVLERLQAGGLLFWNEDKAADTVSIDLQFD